MHVLFVCTAALAASVLAILGHGAQPRPWATFVALAVAAAVAQLFVVQTTHNQSYHLAIVFVIAAALLLPPELVAALCVIQHIPEWVRERYAPVIQGFNIANYTLAALGAWVVAEALLGPEGVQQDARTISAGLTASAVFVLLNHGVLAGMLRVARGHSLRQSGLFSLESLSTDSVLAIVGVGLAAWWQTGLWFAPVAIAPLLLIHRALSIPRLRAEASLDPKTGLYNAGHLNEALVEEVERAARFERPLSVIVTDLDLLRNINNTYGHLSGDAVLRGVAEALRGLLRPYDVAARFGGEEFAVLLPETEFEDAMAIAERIRETVAGQPFFRPGSDQAIPATLSLGVASYPLHAADADELVHQADLALYHSKALGRDRVSGASAQTLVLNRLLEETSTWSDGIVSLPETAPRGFRPYGPERTPEKTPGAFARRLAAFRAWAAKTRDLLTGGPPKEDDPGHTWGSVEEARLANDELRRANGGFSDANLHVRRAREVTIGALARTMKAKDPSIGNHTERVAAVAVALAHRLGYRGEELDAIHVGALLHDIGKLGVPESVLLKSGQLNEEEWEVMREHPVISDYILSEVDLHPFVRQITRWSHERIDGQGYPDGLAGNDIPLPARIALVADAFDALTSDRPYREGGNLETALGELQAHAGSQFCPLVVDALVQLSREEPQVLGNWHVSAVSDVA